MNNFTISYVLNKTVLYKNIKESREIPCMCLRALQTLDQTILHLLKMLLSEVVSYGSFLGHPTEPPSLSSLKRQMQKRCRERMNSCKLYGCKKHLIGNGEQNTIKNL